MKTGGREPSFADLPHPGLEGPDGNALVGVVGMTANAPELERPLPALSISKGFVAGSPVCPEPTCTHPGFPVGKLSAPTARHPCRREIADASSQHVKAITCSPLRKKCLLQEAGGQGEKGTTGNKSHTDETEPFEEGHGHTERSVLALRDVQASG